MWKVFGQNMHRWKCNGINTDLINTFWSCKNNSFLESIVQTSTGYELPINSKITLLLILHSEVINTDLRLITTLLTTAKPCIAQK